MDIVLTTLQSEQKNILNETNLNILNKNKQQKKIQFFNNYTPINKYQCTKCNREFFKESYLIQHSISYHSGNKKQYRCVCGKCFRNKDQLYIHQKKHKMLDKPFKCDLCSKQFLYRIDFMRHHNTHINFRSHICAICKKGFERKDHLRRHITAAHI